MVDRISKLRALLKDSNSAFLITSDVNRMYFSSFRSSAGAMLITKNTATLLVDFRYFESASDCVSRCIDVVCYKKLFDSVNEILKKESITEVLLEDRCVTINEHNAYKKALKANLNIDFQLSDKISDLRMIKSDDEIRSMVEAQAVAEKSFIELLNYIKPGVSEKSLALELEYMMKKNGAERSAFDIICVSGANSSLPHGVPTDKRINSGEFITFDFGSVVDGYHSDMTRTVAVSYATDKMKQIYDIVFDAHNKAAQLIKSGVSCSDVDVCAREYIKSMGYGDEFGHSTGHGVGLEIHERPTVYLSDDTVLKSNMVITVEPGIYLKGEFGVRIEDMYLVTDSGYKDLAAFSKELIII